MNLVDLSSKQPSMNCAPQQPISLPTSTSACSLSRLLTRFLFILPFMGIIMGTISKQMVDVAQPWPGDEEGYIAWQMSWITDFDCDPSDDLRAFHTTFYHWTIQHNGKTITVDKYPTGLSQLIVPFTATAQFIVIAGNHLHLWQMPEDGTATLVIRAAWVGVSCWSIIGIGSMFATIRSLYNESIASIVTCTVWAGTSVFAYTWKLPLWCHGASLSMVCIATYLAIVKLQSTHRAFGTSLLLGFFMAMAMTVRTTNLLLMLPLGLYALYICCKCDRTWLRMIAICTGALPPVAIELATRYFAYGSIFFEGYSYKGETLDWTCPHLGEVLLFIGLNGFRAGQGVLTAHPLTALATIGLFWQAWTSKDQRRWLSLGWLLSLLLTVYLYGCWWFWNLGASYGARWAADFAIVWALGLAYFIHKIHTRPQWAITYLLPLTVWSIVVCV